MNDDALAKKRFLQFSLARLSGAVLIVLGMVVAFSDLVRDGGFRQLGGLLIALGTIEMVVVPLLLGHGVRLWDGLEALEETYALEAVSSSSGVTHLSLNRRPG